MSQKRNKEKFEEVWSKIILPQANDLRSEYIHLPHPKASKKACWKAYKAFNMHCSVNYMRDSEAPLDRHKVAACYMYAVVATHMLHIDDAAPLTLDINLVNERLAITVGCSVLVGYTVETIRNIPSIPEEKRRALESYASQGVRFPSGNEVSHGSYTDDVVKYLGFTYVEQNYNILLLALLLFEWEKTLFQDHDDYVLMLHTRPGEACQSSVKY